MRGVVVRVDVVGGVSHPAMQSASAADARTARHPTSPDDALRSIVRFFPAIGSGALTGSSLRRRTMSPVNLTGTQPGQTGRALRIGNPFSHPQPPAMVTVRPTTASPPAAATGALISSEKSRVGGTVSAE